MGGDMVTNRLDLIVVLAMIVSCDDDTVEVVAVCEGGKEDCVCEVDEDCVITHYVSDVTSEEECYEFSVGCCIYPVQAENTMNRAAAERNQRHHQAFGCPVADYFCTLCNPQGHEFWEECHNSSCVAMVRKD